MSAAVIIRLVAEEPVTRHSWQFVAAQVVSASMSVTARL